MKLNPTPEHSEFENAKFEPFAAYFTSKEARTELARLERFCAFYRRAIDFCSHSSAELAPANDEQATEYLQLAAEAQRWLREAGDRAFPDENVLSILAVSGHELVAQYRQRKAAQHAQADDRFQKMMGSLGKT